MSAKIQCDLQICNATGGRPKTPFFIRYNFMCCKFMRKTSLMCWHLLFHSQKFAHSQEMYVYCTMYSHWTKMWLHCYAEQRIAAINLI